MSADAQKQFRVVVALAGLAAFACGLLATPTAHADNAFEATQQAAAAQNPPGLTCTLSLPDGKTQFRQGELIFLTLTFTSDRPALYALTHDTLFSEMNPAALHVTPTEGTAVPNAAMPTQIGFSYEGPAPPAPTPLSDTPASSEVLVNASLRFDRPGTYQLSVTTSQVVDGQAKSDSPFVTGKAFPVTTNAVQFQIVPADPTWQQAQLKAALAETQDHYSGPMTVDHPWQVLWYLNTRDSARALLSVMGEDQAPRSSEEKGYFCRPALIGFPDQSWLIGEMERDLDAPNYAVTEDFLTTLADLATWRKTPQTRDNGPMLRAYWLRAADAVAHKTDAARPMTLYTLLDEAWPSPTLDNDPAVQQRLPRLSHQLALDFDRLPPIPQEYLLGDQWADFQSPALLPALQRLWKTARVSENNGIFQPDNTTLNGLILRRLTALAPDQGRALTLSEIARPQPRADMDTLGGLPDATLPEMDDTLASRLAVGQDVDATCHIIARYATAAILPQVQAFYGQVQDSTTETALLAYFLRVKPDYGTAMLHQELLHWLGRGMQETLLSDVALVRYNTALGQYALGELDAPDPGVVADAARTLGQYGSASTETALWTRLRRHDADPKSRAVIEQGLVTALATGQGWYTSPHQLRDIRALCSTAEARQEIDGLLTQLGTGPVNVNYEPGDVGYWTIGQHNGRGHDGFLAKMAQFPSGTTFLWQDIGSVSDEERVFTQAQAVAQAHGSSVRRWQPKVIP